MGFDMCVAFRYAGSMSEFRAHSQIVTDAIGDGTAVAFASLVGPDVIPQNVRDWKRRDFIPPDRWMRFVDLGFTTYEELAAHVAAPAPEKAA